MSLNEYQYFGERFDPASCAKTCDNCQSTETYAHKDATEDSITILQLVQSIYRDRVTLNQTVDIWRGANTAKIRECGHDTLPMYKKGKSWPRHETDRLMHQLVSEEILVENCERNFQGFVVGYVGVCIHCRCANF